MKLLYSLLSLSIAASASSKVVNLTDDNFERLTDGKSVFIKYFAPWCGYCKSIAGDWEKVASEWEGSDIGLVAEVDCTADDTQTLCGAVDGFPTIKYGDPSALDEYEGGREYDVMSTFAKENLKPSCSLTNLHLCDEEAKKTIESLKALSFEELLDKLEAVDNQIQSMEDGIGNEIQELEDQINVLIEKYSKASKTLKDESNYKILSALIEGEEDYMDGMEDSEDMVEEEL